MTSKRHIVMAAGVLIVLLILAFLAIRRRRSHTLNPEQFTQRWQELQKQCVSRAGWPAAIIDADNLLDDALKRRRYKGKTTGERLVAAQHTLSSNSAVWFGHKLRNRIAGEDKPKLKKQEVISALSGFREALRDLGALKK